MFCAEVFIAMCSVYSECHVQDLLCVMCIVLDVQFAVPSLAMLASKDLRSFRLVSNAGHGTYSMVQTQGSGNETTSQLS